MKKQVKNNVYWVGKIDWELEEFHGSDYSVTQGSSQNSYLIKEEKTVLIDTVWSPHKDEFIKHLKEEVDLKSIDYLVMNHGEVDHSGSLPALMEEVPDLPIYCTKAAVDSLVGQYHHPEWNFQVVKTGDSLDIGNGKKLVFVEMKMLHWPDSMATYMTGDKILFSNDAFGQHYAVEELFNDYADQAVLWEQAMKYYANILNPFSKMAARKLQEILAMNLDIDLIAPSHGAIWRDHPEQIVEAYVRWADAYQEDQITILYDSMWEATQAIAHRLAREISFLSPSTKVKVFNVAHTDRNDLMTEVFRSKAIAVGSPTVGRDILTSVAGILHFVKELHFVGKKAGVFGSYGWSGEGNKVLRKSLEEAGFDLVEEEVKVKWKPKEEDLEKAQALAQALLD
ncbi:MAG: MBL fold metallo-hydrolase [Tissierellia bacterium]|nr:MBL fold metallo-hydrolase [Tissierellia bacterium]